MRSKLIKTGRKVTGLALGSGGARGAAHIAVIDHLESLGVRIDMVTGTSIGAVVGAVYCCGNLAAFREDVIKMKRRDFLSLVDPVFPRAGLISGRAAMEFLSRYIPGDARIEELEIPLGIVATDLTTGRPVLFRRGSLHAAVRASISIPGIFVPVRSGKTFLVDGGVSCPLPVEPLQLMGAGRVIAVNLNPLRDSEFSGSGESSGPFSDADGIDYLKKAEKQSARPWHWLKSIDSWLDRDSSDSKTDPPNVFESIGASIDIMCQVNTWLAMSARKPDVLIEPELRGAGPFDFTEMSRLMSEGYLACSRVGSDINRKILARQ